MLELLVDGVLLLVRIDLMDVFYDLLGGHKTEVSLFLLSDEIENLS